MGLTNTVWNRRARRTAAALLGLLLALTGGAGVHAGGAASVLHVPQDYPTIQAAIAAAADGDTVSVSPGSYAGPIDSNAKAITIESTGGAAVTRITGGAGGAVATVGASGVLRGFTISGGDNQGAGGGGVDVSGSAVVESNVVTANSSCFGGGMHVTGSPAIRGNTISDNTPNCPLGPGGGGLLVSGSPRITGNTITGNRSSSLGGGISVAGVGGVTVTGNTIIGNTGCRGGGIAVYNRAGVTVANNVIARNASTSCDTPVGGGGIYWLGGDGAPTPIVVNNTIAGNTGPAGSAMYVDGLDKGTVVRNNVMTGSSSQALVYCRNYSETPQIVFNDVVNIGSGTRYEGCPDGTGTSGNIGANPLFVSPSDFRLGCGSPAVDAGTSTNVPTTDIEGTSRPLDGDGDSIAAYDMGAYERGVACQLPAPTPPTSVAATAGSGQATVSFAPPAASASPISSYTVTASPGGMTVEGAASPVTVSGLSNGTSYTFTISATSTQGTGEPSAPSNAVTPGAPEWAAQGGKLPGTGAFGGAVALSADGNTALVGAANDGNRAGAAWVYTRSGGAWTRAQKLTGAGEVGPGTFGYSVALSGDGNTAIVGAPDDGEADGAVWIYTRSGDTWSQQGSKIIGSGAVGVDVALSGDGNTALVGAPAANGGVGEVRVLTRSNGLWAHTATLTGGGANGSSAFGASVSLSTDGNTAAVGGPFDDDVNQFGAAWVFARSGGIWSQQGGKILPNGLSPGAWFGWDIAMSGDGSTAVVGMYPDDGTEGRARVYARSGSAWSLQTSLSYSGAVGAAYFGWNVSVSGDGNTALIGGFGDNGQIGAAWLFNRSGATWTQHGSKWTGAGEAGKASFGAAVALSADAKTALVGGPDDDNGSGAAWPFAIPQAPAAPTLVHASADDSRATVQWLPASEQAGYPITGYMVTPYAGGIPQTSLAVGPGAQATVTGLTNGTSYSFTVTAQTSVASGPASSASNAVTPNVQGREPPDPPDPQPRALVPNPPAPVTRPAVPAH